MLGDRLTLDYLLVALGVVAVLVLQAWLIRRRQAWPGGIVPAGYVILVGYLAVTGGLTQLVDWGFAALGLVLLLTWWAGARRRFTDGRDGNE
jgi:hypothetical protein